MNNILDHLWEQKLKLLNERYIQLAENAYFTCRKQTTRNEEQKLTEEE